MSQKLAPALWPDTGNVIELRSASLALTPLPVTGDGKAVRLVANVLKQMGGGALLWVAQLPTVREQLFQPRLSAGSLGNGQQAHTVDLQLFEHILRPLQLPATPIDYQKVGQLSFALLQASVSTPERLLHSPVIVARGHALDVESPIVRLQRAVSVENDAGRHGRLAHGVADVEALQAFRDVLQTKQVLKGNQAGINVALVGQIGVQAVGRIVETEPHPTGPLTAYLRENVHPAPCPLGQRISEKILVRDALRRDHRARNVSFRAG